jgi:hypothetical protein
VFSDTNRAEARTSTPETPQTMDILCKLRTAWLLQPCYWLQHVWDFHFLRAGEFKIPYLYAYDPDVRLKLADLALDSHINDQADRSKTNPLCQCVAVYLGASNLQKRTTIYLHVQYRSGSLVYQVGAPLIRLISTLSLDLLI